MRREILEETNLTFTRSIQGPIFEGIENGELSDKHFITFSFACFLSSIHDKCSLQLNEELTDYQWVNPKEALDLDLTAQLREMILWYNKRFGTLSTIGLERQAMPARIGIFPEEKTILQTIEMTLHVTYDASQAVQTDDIARGIDYMALLDTCKTLAISKHFALLETLAQSMIDLLFVSYPIEEIELSLSKVGAVLGKNSSVQLHKIRREAVCLGS